MADELSHELFDALNSDNLTIAELLLQKGADPNCVLPVEGVAPIHIASGLGAPATKLLLQCGGEPNIRSVDGTTPLHVASMWGNEACLQLLLLFGGDPFIRDQDGCTALDYAKSYDHKHCIRQLEYFALLLSPDSDSIIAPKIIYKCRDEMEDNISDRSSKAVNHNRRQSVNQSFGYLEEYLDWAYNQDSITEYTDEITRQLRKYMSHHAENQLSLDVTSPDHPYLEHKNQSEDSDVSSVETNDLAFRQDSLHVHWADELSKTLPWNLSEQDKLNSASSSTDTFLTCPSELDDKDYTYLEKSNVNSYKQDYLSKENRPPNVSEPRNMQKNVVNQVQDMHEAQNSNRFTNGNVRENLRKDSKCLDCESLRKHDSQKFSRKSRSSSDNVCSHVKLPDDISNIKLPGNLDRLSRKPKVRCEREIQNWLNSAQPEKLSCELKRMSLQDSKRDALWQPPLECQELDLTDLISSDGSFYERHGKQTESKSEKLKSSSRSSGSGFVSNLCNKAPQREVFAKLPINLLHNVRDSCSLSYSSAPVENLTLTERLGNFSTIDLEETLSYDLENYCKDSESSSRNSVESVESDVFNRSFCDSRISFGSVSSDASTVEYIYSDPEKGISLIERRVPSQCGSLSSRRSSLESALSTGTVDSQKTELYDWKTHCKYQMNQNGNSVLEKDEVEPSNRKIPQMLKNLSNQEIREKLQILGDDPGPVTLTTRQTYLTRLMNAEEDPNFIQMQLTKQQPGYPPEMKAALEGNFDANGMAELEMRMITAFQNPAKNRRWREGTLKSSFNYLLLDPRVTRNLPQRSGSLSTGELETFQTFIAAIFYVGKGKRARPYCHLYEAINHLKNPKPKVSEKVQHILDVWKDGLGVVSLHCFQSVIPVEAYTREACMVDSLSLNKLTNKKRGDYYGVATTWSLKDKRRMGVYLLKKSLQIFLGDGERQISPADIKVGQ